MTYKAIGFYDLTGHSIALKGYWLSTWNYTCLDNIMSVRMYGVGMSDASVPDASL